MGNVHVANGSSSAIRARAAQEKIQVKEIDATGKLSFPFSLEASVKIPLEHSLDELSFARIGPGESLEFDLRIIGGDEYITIVTDEATPMVICYNYNPPSGRSVIVTDNNTIQLSERKGDMWKTDNGICYGGSCLVGQAGHVVAPIPAPVNPATTGSANSPPQKPIDPNPNQCCDCVIS